ncbi:hypothetical protein [Acanthopleuribacter pedis]|uniref:Uncharacterized protein n=1 Tax=Acanthopleuribacter pedis TaxID=442870 RepID=A0A8J7U3L5_9BACT|nr:hypothetical protein [Acanthopleuribacter pedis]MBO1319742.1 hypothetical protein [Acanthopleuribacter pedis]
MNRIVIVSALFFGGWLVLWTGKTVLLNESQDHEGVYVSEGYLETVDLFIKHDWLTYDKETREIVKNFEPGSAMAQFFNKSYLKNDVRGFNNGNRDLFRVRNGRLVGADPYAHNIVMPFSERAEWEGHLTFRPVDQAHATLEGRNIVLTLTEQKKTLFRRSDYEDVVLPDLSGAFRPINKQGDGLVLIGRGGMHFGRVQLMGSRIVFTNRNRENQLAVSISGEPVEQGIKARLDPGDLLKFNWPSGKKNYYTMLYASGSHKAPPIAQYRSINGVFRHSPSQPEPPFYADILNALNQTYRRDGGKPGVLPEAGFDLALSLDASLQGKAQRHLTTFAEQLRQKNGVQGLPFRAAMTVMDAGTGEILAMASYPDEATVGPMRDSAKRRRLLGNHNLSRLPIGSVAKVMWSAAILHDEPELRHLKIPGAYAGTFEDLLGIEIHRLRDHNVPGGDDGMIDFREFIAQSSNRYAAILLTLATGFEAGAFQEVTDSDLNTGLPEHSRFQLGDRTFRRRPHLPLGLENTQDGLVRAQLRRGTLENEDHAGAMLALFDVPYSRSSLTRVYGPGDGDDFIDTRPWRPLLEHLYREEIPVKHAFYGVSPERESLNYNLADQFRSQYISMILGGGDSLWTNIKVCEVFSRLVSGEKIEATLVKSIQPHRLQMDPGVLGLSRAGRRVAKLNMEPIARKTLLEAMAGVVKPNGTAAILRKDLVGFHRKLKKKGKALGFFSKTGSPDNVRYVPTPTTGAIQALIDSGALSAERDGQISYRGQVLTPGSDADEGHRFETLLRRNPGDVRILRRRGVSPLLVHDLVTAHNQDTPRERAEGPFDFQGGRLVGFKSVSEVRSFGGVFTFTIAIYDRMAVLRENRNALPKIDVANHHPEKALTVSVVIENNGSSGKTAVPFTKNILKEVVFHALETGW